MGCNRCGCNTTPCCCNKAGQQIVGPPGPMGFQGPQGPRGQQGSVGNQGIQGPTGYTGAGIQGPTGPIGPTGSTGYTGPASPGGGVESGSFTRTAPQGSGVQNIPTTGQVKMVFFNCLSYNGTGNEAGSTGKDDGILASSFHQNPLTGSINGDLVDSLWTFDFGFGSGFTGRITAINPTSFDITWVAISGGIDTDVQWHAIT